MECSEGNYVDEYSFQSSNHIIDHDKVTDVVKMVEPYDDVFFVTRTFYEMIFLKIFSFFVQFSRGIKILSPSFLNQCIEKKKIIFVVSLHTNAR